MNIQRREVFHFLQLLSRQENMKVCVNESLKGGAIAGSGAVIGGVLLGPLGLAIGGTIGSVFAYLGSKPFKPFFIVLEEMSESERQKISDAFIEIFHSANIFDFAKLAAIVAGNSAIKEMIVKEVFDYAHHELQMRLT